MRLGVVAFALVVACGGQPHEVARTVPAVAEPPPLRIVPLKPGSFMWPLTQPPSVEPHYRVGFTWPLVCERHGVLPDDVLHYIDAWCASVKNPRFDASDDLARLRSSKVPGLSTAVVLDLANRGAGGDREIDEVVIALDVERGHIDTATEVAKTYVTTIYSEMTCGQDLFSWVFELDPRNIDWLPGLVRRHGTTACGKQFRRLACIIWSASGRAPRIMSECSRVAFDEDDRAIVRAVRARLRWSPSLTADEYLEIAKLASSALVLYDAEGFAIDALQRALQVSCRRVEKVREIAALIDGDHRRQEQFADARAELISLTERQCLERQGSP